MDMDIYNDIDDGNQHEELLMEFIESDNKCDTITNMYLSSTTENKSYSNVVFGILTSYISGEYDEEHTEDFLLEYHKLFDDSERIKIVTLMLSEWLDYVKKTFSDDHVYNILLKLLTTIKTIQIIISKNGNNKLKMFNKEMTKKIWELKSFRSVIYKFPDQISGDNYAFFGMFCSLFTMTGWEDDFDSYLTAIDPIIKDENVHNNFIEYLYKILKINIPYTYDDKYLIKEKHCSPVNFNTFVMKILFKLLKWYSFENVINTIETGEQSYIIKNSEISDLPLFHKLYSAALYAIPICHISALKNYHGIKSELKIGFLTSVTRKAMLKADMERLVGLLNTNDNGFIQNIYLSYPKLLTKLENPELFSEVVSYIDYMTSFSPLENFYGVPNKKLFHVLSNITGGYNECVKNVHVRHYACSVIFKLLKNEGFNAFENLFENLFKYISEVDFFEWTSPIAGIEHQYKLVEAIYFLTDLYDHEIDGARNMIAGTLFILLRSAIKIFNRIHDICVHIKSQGIIVANETSDFQKMVDTISMTLQIHQSVYEKGIIKIVYPEVEDKYAILIYDLLSASTNINHELYTILRRPDLAANITNVTYESLSSHINFCSKYLMKVRDIIIDNIGSYSKLPKDKKDNIITKLTLTKNVIIYPPEFLDPILCTEIMDPVKIPSIDNEIFDRVSILTHIYDSKENPYTRELLTVEMLEEYNRKDNIIAEINEFLEKKKIFEENTLLSYEDTLQNNDNNNQS